VSAYRAAIDQTTSTIDRRARHFRNLVIAVVALSVGSMGWALAAWRVLPLAGLLLLIPACGFFFFLDGRLLSNWLSHLMDAWVKKDIDFRAFCDAIGAVPGLPKDTLRSMLATLPSARDLVAEQGVSSSTREGVAATVGAIHACQSDIVALKAAAAAIASGFIVIAVACRRWEPLLGGLAVTLLPVLGRWLKRRRMELLKERMFAARTKPDFSIEKYGQLVTILRWDPISPSEKDALLNRLA
jgi:hypothetical protein